MAALLAKLLQLFKNKAMGPYMVLFLVACALIVTLGVSGIIKVPGSIETAADEAIVAETGVDLEKVEEAIEKKP